MILPASLSLGADGTPRSETYDDIYHAAEGGPGQARHVFLAGNELPRRWQGRERFILLETGFGTGLNFLATWAAWRDDPNRPGRLHYLAVEKHPFRRDDLARLHARWPEFADLAAALRERWPVLTPGMHRLELDGGRVILTLLLGDAEALLARLAARVDAIYLDGFDPRKNPAMWSPELLRRLGRLAAENATLATWCVAGPVREALRAAGFTVGKRPGYARKRHMLAGAAARGQPAAAAPVRQALVIGAGVAGCAVSERLAARGWRVVLLEGRPRPAQAASGNLAGIVRPLLSRDDNLASRLNRAAFLHARRAWKDLAQSGRPPRLALDGALQIARDAQHQEQMRRLAQQGGYPEDYVLFLEREEAARRLGADPGLGGWYFPQGGWANPPSLCAAWLAAAGDALQARFNAPVHCLERRDGLWRALDPDGRLLAEAPHVLLAGGADAVKLLPELPMRPVRGQVSHVPQGLLPALPLPLCREGYLTPAVDGVHCLGASYAYDDGEELREEEHAGNLRRLALMLPGQETGLIAARLDGRVGFRAATPDRLPLAGTLPDLDIPLPRDVRPRNLPRREGLHALLGLGSRGLVWAALTAEILASQLEGDPAPVEQDLLDALDPGRFHLRAHRRGKTAE